MVFSSLIFVFLFLPIVLLSQIIIQHTKIRNVILLLASIVFYSWGEPIYVFLFVFTILLNYAMVLIADISGERKKKIIGAVAIIIDVLILFWFKYSAWVGAIFGLSLAQQVLPVGISFYTFQAISYVVDVVFFEKYKAEKNIVNMGLYIAFFPQLIAGPIIRYEQMKEQIRSRTISIACLEQGSFRFILGLCKKVLLADSIAIIVENAFSLGDDLSMPFAWLGAVAYTFQIYLDFSGYSDMAIGLGKMFGFTIPENFTDPYKASTIRDFWRRWHITLSIWFRDYVYIPLGGSRLGKATTIRNMAIVWMLTGLWHGANWTFIIWGGIYGLLVIIEKEMNVAKRLETMPGFVRVLYRLFTMAAVICLWVIFRAENIHTAGIYLQKMFCLNFQNIDIFVLYFSEFKWAILGCCLYCFFPISKIKLDRRIYWPILFVFFIISISYLVKGTYSPFLYFHF